MASDTASAVETRRRPETPLQKLQRQTSDFLRGLVRTGAIALVLLPVILASFLAIDIPVRTFDHLFAIPATKPGLWLRLGDLYMASGVLIVILAARRYGGDEASRAVVAAWALAAVLAVAEIAILAPVIEPGDFPSLRFVGAFVAGSMTAQLTAAGMFDILRGGGAWWRAPFYSALIGYGAGAAIYFPVAYWTAVAPWLNWMVVDFGVKAAIAAAFLPLYSALRKKLKPVGGLGG